MSPGRPPLPGQRPSGLLADLRGLVLEHPADDQAVLVVDETGDLKKGTHTVGVQRQYTGTAGRIENAQVVVYLTYTSRHGHAALDRAPYLPKSWTSAPARCEQAAVPDTVGLQRPPRDQLVTVGCRLRWSHRVNPQVQHIDRAARVSGVTRHRHRAGPSGSPSRATVPTARPLLSQGPPTGRRRSLR